MDQIQPATCFYMSRAYLCICNHVSVAIGLLPVAIFTIQIAVGNKFCLVSGLLKFFFCQPLIQGTSELRTSLGPYEPVYNCKFHCLEMEFFLRVKVTDKGEHHTMCQVSAFLLLQRESSLFGVLEKQPA